MNADDAVMSCGSSELSINSDFHDFNKLGDLMVCNVFLGGLGWYTIRCYSKEKASSVAERFCKQQKLTSVFKSVVTQAI